MDEQNQISQYDRLRGTLNALYTKPSTVKNVESVTGRSETFVIETGRTDEGGDYVFIERTNEAGVTRLVLPPKVANLVASQREALTKRRRRSTAKRVAAERIANGWKPSFKKKSA
jgi:hypothetical protein